MREGEIVFFKKKEKFRIPVSGRIIPLEEVNDPAFSNKALGDGFAIKIDEGHIYAPFSGEVTLVYPTHHAYGLKNKKGMEVLIHVGLDTVNLNGQGLTSYVKQGDKIYQGDLMCDVDMESLKENYDLTTPVIFVSGETVNVSEYKRCKALEEDIIHTNK